MATNADDDIWGDDDEFLDIVSQMDEQSKQDARRIEGRNESDNKKEKSFVPIPTGGISYAQQALAQARERLNGNHSPGSTTHQPGLSPSHWQTLVDSLKKEKDEISTKYYAAQGEKENLRRELNRLKRSDAESTIKSMDKDATLRRQYEDRERTLKQEIVALNTTARRLQDENSSLKAKNSMNSTKLSVGGATTMHQRISIQQMANSKAPSPIARGISRPKSGSDPNMSSYQQAQQSQEPTQIISPKLQNKVIYTESSTQAEEGLINSEIRDEQVFSEDRTVIDISKLKSVAEVCGQKVLSVRDEDHGKMANSIRSEYLNIKSVLEQAVNLISKGIMSEYAPGPKYRWAVRFPDYIETLFMLQIEAKKKLECEERRVVYQERTCPVIPSPTGNCVIDIEDFHTRIKDLYIHGGCWACLREIKRMLKEILASCADNLRFKIFEPKALSVLWYLLAWAKRFWELIVFEEEFDEIVEYFGKETWIEELKEWTGLILKVDWRDHFNDEIEKIFRNLSLSILSSIVMAGYFEQSQKRYEILYQIIKDTLMKSHLRTPKLLKKCLIILTWSLADIKIFSYLCQETHDDRCLASVIADFVLKCFKETSESDHHSATLLLVFYLNFLENLMTKQPNYLYASKIARPSQHIVSSYEVAEKVLNEDEEKEKRKEEGDQTDVNNRCDVEEQMDVDLEEEAALTQFACPERYKFEDGCMERAKSFKNKKEVECWLNPENWEFPHPSNVEKEKPCQCRKFLLGNVFIMLYSVTNFWEKAFEEHEQKIEKNEVLDYMQAQRNKEIGITQNDEINKKLEAKVGSLRKFISEFLKDPNRNKEDGNDDKDGVEDDGDFVQEWTSDDLLNFMKNSQLFKEETDWADEKRRPENIYDYVMRRAAYMMCFSNYHSINLALTLRSEGYANYTLLEPILKFYKDNMHITLVEKRNILGPKASENEIGNEPYDDATNIFYLDDDDNDADDSFTSERFNILNLEEVCSEIRKKILQDPSPSMQLECLSNKFSIEEVIKEHEQIQMTENLHSVLNEEM